MKKELWQSDQPVLSDDLELAQGSKEDAIRERLTDTFSPGINKGDLNEFSFSVNLSVNTSFDINTGVSYDPKGERIVVGNSNVQYVNPTVSGNVLSSGNPSASDGTPNGPLTTTDDGIGGFTATPQISGCKGIPMASFLGNVGYVFIAYLQTTNQTVFTLQEITNKKLFTKGEDGYQIIVVENAAINVDPDTINPDLTKYIYLGFVDFRTGSSLSPGSFNTNGRKFYSLKKERLNAVTPNAPKTDRTLVYGSSQIVSLDEHVKAVGSGTVTATNPHGISSADLGITGKSTEQHEQLFHASGIIGDQSSLTSSLKGEINAVAGAPLPPTFGLDTFKVYPLSATEFANINGVTLGNADIPILNEFYFSSSVNVVLPDGVYRLFLNNVSKTIRMAVVASAGTSISGTSPQTTSNPGDTLTININGDGPQSIVLGFNVNGPAVAANIQSAVQALTAANPLIQPAYASFTCTFTSGVYVLTSGAYNAGASSVVVSPGLGIAALLKLGVGNGGSETVGAGAGGTYRRAISGVFTELLTEDYATTVADPNNLPLHDVTFLGSLGPGVGNNNIPAAADKRIFGITGSNNLARDAATDTVTIGHSVAVSGSLSIGGNFSASGNISAGLKIQEAGLNLIPSGVMLPYAGATAPNAGWLLCDGASYSTTLYPDLFAAIGTLWGSVGAGFFNVPDLRGRFMRGQDAGAGRDPNALTRTAAPGSPGGSTDRVGTTQSDMIGNHSHSNVSVIGHDAGPGVSSTMGSYSPDASFPESRPKNANVLYIIKT